MVPCFNQSSRIVPFTSNPDAYQSPRTVPFTSDHICVTYKKHIASQITLAFWEKHYYGKPYGMLWFAISDTINHCHDSCSELKENYQRAKVRGQHEESKFLVSLPDVVSSVNDCYVKLCKTLEVVRESLKYEKGDNAKCVEMVISKAEQEIKTHEKILAVVKEVLRSEELAELEKKKAPRHSFVTGEMIPHDTFLSEDGMRNFLKGEELEQFLHFMKQENSSKPTIPPKDKEEAF